MLAHTASESKVSEPKAANESLQQIRREQIRRGQGFPTTRTTTIYKYMNNKHYHKRICIWSKSDEQMSALHAVARAAAQAEAKQLNY